VGDERSLLICCKAFRANIDSFANLTVKKIPQAVLRKCEWGRDDYSLNVASLPLAEPESEDAPGSEKRPKGKPAAPLPLFDQAPADGQEAAE
jgi:adenine-specific DNA-methyltransferase